MNKYNKELVLYESSIVDKKFISEGELLSSKDIITYGRGVYGFKGSVLSLFDIFDKIFLDLIKDYHVEIRKYPVLLPIKTYKGTNYLKTSPQYAIFCSLLKDEVIGNLNVNELVDDNDFQKYLKNPQNALSPSACFHLYEELRDEKFLSSQIYTFCQKVFRNEGEKSYSLYRLQDYSVREMVILGDEVYVKQVREELLQKIKMLIETLGLVYRIEIASDPFVIPEMKKYKEVQIKNQVKYEVNLAVDKDRFIAAASLNFHGHLFSNAFNFDVCDAKDTVTGCIGFGIERWIVAFLSQYGMDHNKWPKCINNYLI